MISTSCRLPLFLTWVVGLGCCFPREADSQPPRETPYRPSAVIQNRTKEAKTAIEAILRETPVCAEGVTHPNCKMVTVTSPPPDRVWKEERGGRVLIIESGYEQCAQM